MIPDFEYQTYDRHMFHLLNMSQQLTDNWQELSGTELNCDLYSLRTKAARLCSMSDNDFILQQQDLSHSRKTQNINIYQQLHTFVYEQIMPLIVSLLKEIDERIITAHPKQPDFPIELGSMMQRLVQILPQDERQRDGWDTMQEHTQGLEKLFKEKHIEKARFPGMTLPERMKYILQFFTLMCYLLYHFQRVVQLADETISDEEAGRLLLSSVQNYTETCEGEAELQRYQAALSFDNDNKPLSLEQLREARKALRKDVPESLQTVFMQHINAPEQLAQAVLKSQAPQHDIKQLVAAIAKWQILSAQIHTLEHPETIQPALYNEIFNNVVHDTPIDMLALRNKLLAILPLITRKNHWFCLWCVLRHRNLLKTDNYEAFARQMQMDEWLGKHLNSKQRFNGETLRGYSGYMNYLDFTRWNYNDFVLTRDKLNKTTKWGDKLFNTFQHLCYEMDEQIGCPQFP